MDFLKRSWCSINLDNLDYNINLLKKIAKKDLISVVKANAYGHGDKEVALKLQKCGIKWFAVSNYNEAHVLRKAGITGEILILGYTPPEYAGVMIDENITQTVYCIDYAKSLANNIALGKLKVHIKVDTGMNRIGFNQSENHDALEEVLKMKSLAPLDICGMFTHFSCADSFASEDEKYTLKQMKVFDKLSKALKENGVRLEYLHVQNSAGITNYESDKEKYNLARAGILMYGLPHSADVKGDVPVRPLLEWRTIVEMVKMIPKGSQVSYGRTFTADKPISVATLTIGYADGYLRAFSNKADVLIHGKRCRILGRVCMDQMVVDVTGMDVKIGDTAVVLGRDGDEEITADELARIAGTINYEIVCGISRRVPRVYYENSEIVDVADDSL